MTKKTGWPRPAVFVAAAVLLCLLPSVASGQTGSIRGRVHDEAGSPIPGAYLYLSSASLIATLNYIASERGAFWFAQLPSGEYTLIAEKPGFKTFTMEGVFIAAGSTALVNIRLEPTEIEEEPLVREYRRSLDAVSAANLFSVDRELINRVPAPREFSHILGLVPGVVFGNGRPDEYPSIHGGSTGANVTAIDRAVVSDPVTGGIIPCINVDFIDEVIVETAAHPVDRGPAEGGFINIVHKPGGNTGSGEFSVYHTGGVLSKSLFSPTDLEGMNVSAPVSDKRLWDFSFSVGGPVVRDLAWIFTNFRYFSRNKTAPFMPWADPLGTMHWDYFFDNREISGLVKLTARVEARYSGFLEFSTSSVRQPAYEPDISWNRPRESTRFLNGEKFNLARAGFTYSLSQSTFLTLSAGYAGFKEPLVLNALGKPKPRYIDLGTGYVWGSAGINDFTRNSRFTGAATLTAFLDRILGAGHEIKLGAEYESMTGRSSVWKTDNLTHYYAFRDPYLYGQAVSPESGNAVGFGLVAFTPVPWEQGGLVPKKDLLRFGLFLQDSLTFASRVALSLGVRFDRSEVSVPSYAKGISGNAVSFKIGEDLIEPLIGLNPFAQVLFSAWNGVVTWNTLSPRASLSIDLFGKGKTLVKASLARYPEYLQLGYSEILLPIDKNRSHEVQWYDEDGDSSVDEDDTYVLVPEDYRIYQQEFYEKRIDPALKSPTTDEWTAGLEQEIDKGFSLSFRYISKTKKNIIGGVLYDPETDTSWYTSGSAAASWWIPFETVVPAAEGYPETQVTLYFPAADAPAFFDRIQNVPELRRRYRAFEFTLRKRWSGSWQLAGSLVLGRSTGTSGLSPGWNSGISSSALSPNSFVNVAESSRLDLDRPLTFKLMGTARLPWNVFLSLYFQASSGAPWARSVMVIPPESWVQANGARNVPVTVYLEDPGSRRRESWKNLDLRIHKEFSNKGRTFLVVSLDVLNVLGETIRFLDLNDGGLWYPNTEGTAEGQRILSETYNKVLSVWGTRTVALRLKLKF